MRLSTVAPLAFLLAACAGAPRARVHPAPAAAGLEPGTLIDSERKPIDLEEFAREASAARFVLLGEGHDIACDHEMQARLLEALAESGAMPAVGFEMVESGMQPVLDRFGSELTAAELGDALSWQEEWGYDYALYLPIMEVAEREKLPLVALNLPREIVQQVGREGADSLTQAQRAELPPQIVPPPHAQEAMLREAFAAHGMEAQEGDERYRNFAEAQSLWDSQMAYRAAEAAKRLGRPVAIVVGAGHVTNGWGIEYRLATFAPEAKVISVAPWRGITPPAAGEADFYYFCPRPLEK